jgi:hypothetical protein
MVATQIEGAISPRPKDDHLIDLYEETGAGEGIRTLDPNLGNFKILIRCGAIEHDISLKTATYKYTLSLPHAAIADKTPFSAYVLLTFGLEAIRVSKRYTQDRGGHGKTHQESDRRPADPLEGTNLPLGH